MPRFFVCKDQIENNCVKIFGDDAFHVSRALRMAAGEQITACDEDGLEYLCTLERFDPDSVTARIITVSESDAEPPFFAHVFQGLPKGDKLETVIQKAVECGATAITPFESDFCIARAKPEAEEKRTERRRRIAAEAAKQCGRAVLPEVGKTVSYGQMLEQLRDFDTVIFCYEGEGTIPLGRILSTVEGLIRKGERPKVAVVVGSEGGFSDKEAQAARNAGFSLCGLGKRILRTETAATFVLCSMVCTTELS